MADVLAPVIEDGTLEVLRRVAIRAGHGAAADPQDLLALARSASALLVDRLYLGRLRALATMPNYYEHSGHPEGDFSPRCQGCAYTEGIHTGWVVAIHERAARGRSADPRTEADLVAALGVCQMALEARTEELRLSIARDDALERRAQTADKAVVALQARVRELKRAQEGAPSGSIAPATRRVPREGSSDA